MKKISRGPYRRLNLHEFLEKYFDFDIVYTMRKLVLEENEHRDL